MQAMTPNEVRADLGLQPVEWGDKPVLAPLSFAFGFAPEGSEPSFQPGAPVETEDEVTIEEGNGNGNNGA